MWQRMVRTSESEILEGEGASARGQRILADLERWSQVAGWTRRHIEGVQSHWEALGRPDPFRVLDVGVGLGGLLEHVEVWAAQRGVRVELYGVAHEARLAEVASERLGGRAVVQSLDGATLHFGDRAMHLALCTLTLHHIDPVMRLQLVAELERVARSVYLFDLVLTLHGVVGAAFVPRLAGVGRDAAHDGWIGVRRACTVAEFEALVERLDVRATHVFPSAMCTMPAQWRRARARPARSLRFARMRLSPSPSFGGSVAVPRARRRLAR